MKKNKCPECGDTDSAICSRSMGDGLRIYFVECLSCGHSGTDAESKETAEQLWRDGK